MRKAKEEKTKTLEIWNYAKPIFVIIFAITIFYSLDVIIAKIVFPVEIFQQSLLNTDGKQLKMEMGFSKQNGHKW